MQCVEGAILVHACVRRARACGSECVCVRMDRNGGHCDLFSVGELAFNGMGWGGRREVLTCSMSHGVA